MIPKSTTPVLALHHYDGFSEFFGAGLDVHAVNLPPANSPTGEAELDRYLKLALPPRFWRLYQQTPRQYVHLFEQVTADDLARRETMAALMRVQLQRPSKINPKMEVRRGR